MVAATNPAAAAPKKMLEEATGVEGDSGEDGSPAAQMAVESGADSTAAESDDGTAGLRGTRKKLDNKNGLSLVMGRTTHHKKMKKLHHEIKRGDPKKIYPLSSFSIDCKGDVCKGDTILFKQKVFKKRKGKQDTQCIGRRTIAGKVVKEKYTKKRQLHNFTIMVLWSEGVNNLPALHQLIISGHQLYRFMTWRQPWHNDAVRLEVLKEKHERGNAARWIRALRISSSGGSVQPLFCPLIPGLPPLNQISNHSLLHACGAPVACLNLSLPPANGVVSYFPSDLMGSRVRPSVTFSPFNMPGRFHHPNPGAGLMPYFRFLGSNNDFPW
ncbi:hypothetical protein E2562_006994 [Oryza meyeriana var. granulata]|uniref:DUF7699 domain-containing protein n=1 Tax=Oryza meyeriana var. granulata TaxID=110450 RepID=A0A6G1E9J4_9ORYZ|nr:hypothetical protein E2562_006994 [Oryza meyeriana var. granulata]